MTDELISPGGDNWYRARGGIQPIDLIEDWGLTFGEGAIVKYVYRWPWKGGLTDLRKAQWYLGRVIDQAQQRTAVQRRKFRRGRKFAAATANLGIDKFVKTNEMPPVEAAIIWCVLMWGTTYTTHDLFVARIAVTHLIAQKETEANADAKAAVQIDN